LLTLNSCFETIVFLSLYLFLYNISLIVIFLNFFSFISIKSKTLFSFNEFKLNFFLLTTTFISLLSMAGVPPFVGFFSKLFLLIILSSSNFFVFFTAFFSLLFFGLYFYTQNLRFILTSSNKSINYAFDLYLRTPSFFFFLVTTLTFLIFFGIFFLDDLILFFYWLFS
jgi:NADH:ubiquinone oxidoreductase subunit 2 (subunit N)